MDFGLRATWEIAPFAAMLVLAIVALAAAKREKRLLWFFVPLLLSEAFLLAASTVRYDSSESTKEIITLTF